MVTGHPFYPLQFIKQGEVQLHLYQQAKINTGFWCSRNIHDSSPGHAARGLRGQ